jgi:hypothetical protein
MGAFSQKVISGFGKMRVRTRVSICARLGMAIFLTIAGLAQIVYSTDADKIKSQHPPAHYFSVED